MFSETNGWVVSRNAGAMVTLATGGGGIMYVKGAGLQSNHQIRAVINLELWFMSLNYEHKNRKRKHGDKQPTKTNDDMRIRL